jgi:hypothetical protein
MGFVKENLTNYVALNEKTLIGKAILNAKTIDLINFQPGIKGASQLNLLDASATLQAGGCGWTPAGKTTLSKRNIVTGLFKVNEDYCDTDLNGTFAEWAVNEGIGKTTLPFEEVITSKTIESIQKQVEMLVWKGDTAGATGTYLDITDGYIKIIGAASGVIDATEAGVSLATNPVEAVNAIVSKIPDEIIDASDLVIFAGYEVIRKYIADVNASNSYHFALELTPDLTVIIPGTQIKLVGVGGLNGTNKAYASTLSNFYAGGDIKGDETQYKFWYSEDNSVYRLKVQFNIGVQVAFPDFIVKYIG